jgi:hypothetical protein
LDADGVAIIPCAKCGAHWKEPKPRLFDPLYNILIDVLRLVFARHWWRKRRDWGATDDTGKWREWSKLRSVMGFPRKLYVPTAAQIEESKYHDHLRKIASGQLPLETM